MILSEAQVFAVSDPAAGKRGMRALLVPTDSPGYVVDKVQHKPVQKASDTCAIRFDDLFVPDDMVLGRYGYPEDYGAARVCRDMRVGQIYEGTSDIQRIVIARALAA